MVDGGVAAIWDHGHMSVATWLSDLVAPPPVHHGLLDDLRAHLDARAAAAAARVDEDHLPLRLPKSRLGDLGRCERLAVARAAHRDDTPTWSPAALRGVALDRFVAHQLVAGRVLDPGEVLRGMLAADASWSALAAVEDLDDGELSDLVDPLAEAVAQGWSGIDDAWAPRTQSSAMLVLADAQVVCSSVLDVELGGPPGDLPAILVEVKSGRPVSEHASEVYLYALLVALRDGAAPAEVARWYPGAAPAAIAVTDGLLETAAARLEDGIVAWAQLAAGRPPDEAPGVWCRWCPDAPRCPSVERGDLRPDRADGDDPGEVAVELGAPDPFEDEEPW
jgi:hypothetical protein